MSDNKLPTHLMKLVPKIEEVLGMKFDWSDEDVTPEGYGPGDGK